MPRLDPSRTPIMILMEYVVAGYHNNEVNPEGDRIVEVATIRLWDACQQDINGKADSCHKVLP